MQLPTILRTFSVLLFLNFSLFQMIMARALTSQEDALDLEQQLEETQVLEAIGHESLQSHPLSRFRWVRDADGNYRDMADGFRVTTLRELLKEKMDAFVVAMKKGHHSPESNVAEVKLLRSQLDQTIPSEGWFLPHHHIPVEESSNKVKRSFNNWRKNLRKTKELPVAG